MCTLPYHYSRDILVSSPQIVVATKNGYKFLAGEALKWKRKEWVAISTKEAKPKVFEMLSTGWNPPTTHKLAPCWFQSIPLTPLEQQAWDEEVVALLQMGSIEEVTWPLVRRQGLPQVVLPIFMVDEGDKYRPIIDARYSNSIFAPQWFKLPKITEFLSLLRPDMWWFKCDVKSGWHHIPIHNDHSNFFCFVWKDRLFRYKICPFGDSTAPYAFTIS